MRSAGDTSLVLSGDTDSAKCVSTVLEQTVPK